MMTMFGNVRVSGDKGRTAAYHMDGSAYLVSLWTAARDRIAVVETFRFTGPTYGKDSLAARIMAKRAVAMLVA